MLSLRLLLIALLFFSAAAPLAAEPGAAGADRPNVIFILCDDLGWGDLGVFYQNNSEHVRSHRTPYLDQMAAEGMQLRAHYCPAPVCAPSRASLLTGVHQGHAGVRNNQFDKALAENHNLATVLKAAGYRTAIIGKYGLQGEGKNAATWTAYPTRRGFDEFFGYVRHVDGHVHYPADQWPLGNSEKHRSPKQVWHNDQEVSAKLEKCYTTDLFTAASKHWVSQQATENPDQPFFLYLAYDTPHAALQVPSVPYPEGSGLDGGIQWLGEPGRMINTADGEIDSYRHPDYVGRGWSDVEERFATMVRRIDRSVGDLLQTLRDLEIDQETLVVLSSDNGPHHESYLKDSSYDPTSFQSYGKFDGTKRDTWEGGIRMPTLAWWPENVPAGKINRSPSQFHDWMPTFAELAGIDAPARTDGVSLVPSLLDRGEQAESLVYIEYAQRGRTKKYDDFLPRRRGAKRGEMQVIHLDGYKGVRVDIASHQTPFEIYDLKKDPEERTNLAGTSERFQKLQQRMKDRVLQIRMQNPIAKRPYDGEAVPAVDLDNARQGLRWRLYEGDFSFVPKLAGREAAATGTGDAPVVKSPGAIQYSGWIKIPEEGDYTFSFSPSAPALMRIHEATVVDADYGYEAGESFSGTIRLARGFHPIRITQLADAETDPGVVVTWATDGEKPTEVPRDAWFSR